MSEASCRLATPLGTIRLAWTDEGLTRLQLPEGAADPGERPPPASAPAWLAEATALLRRYFAGEVVDFASLPVAPQRRDAFERTVYAAARSIPWGQVLTYGELARRLGSTGPDAARAVGRALARNPVAIVVPCHRVVAGGRKLGGFSAPGGRTTKQRLLALEQAAAETDTLRLL